MNIVFDLDGTLANFEHRQHMISDVARQKSEATAWENFFAACTKDKPIQTIINILVALVDAGHDVSIWTGRSEAVRHETNEWLKKFVGFIPPMRMRPVGDFTPDSILKHRWLVLADANPDIVFEDRKGVVDMFRKYGIQCVQVAEGNY